MRYHGKLRAVCAMLFAAMLALLSATVVFAAGSDRVHDAAGLFTEQEISEISALIYLSPLTSHLYCGSRGKDTKKM